MPSPPWPLATPPARSPSSPGQAIPCSWDWSRVYPGGNITGNTTVSRELSAKRLEVLRALLPKVIRVAELVDPANEYVRLTRGEYEKTYRALGMQPIFVEIPESTQLARAFAQALDLNIPQSLLQRADGLIQ